MTTWSAYVDAIRAAELKPASLNLELYRRDVLVPGGAGAPVRLSVVDVGPAQPEQTLLLIHGFAGTSAWWRYQMEALMTRYRVIALDLRGHGWSGRPAAGYRLAQLADDMAAVLDALPVTMPVIVGGHSVGGFVAAELALRYPARVAGLILIATPAAIRRQDLPWPARLALRLPNVVVPLLQPLYQLYPKGRRDNAYLRGLKQLFSADVLDWNGEERLPGVRQPTLVITGDRDLAFPGLAYMRVAELIPQAEHVNVGVSKHQVLLERPKAVVRAIERFLQSLSAAGQAAWQPQWRSENDAVDTIQLLRNRPWVARYETGVPETLEVPRVPLTRLLDTAARRSGLRPAVRRGNQVVTYRRWRLDSNRLAQGLRGLGVEAGEHVLLALPGAPGLAVAFYGVLRAGAVAALLPPGLTIDEARVQAEALRVHVLIAGSDQAPLAQALAEAGRLRHWIVAGDEDYVPLMSRQPQSALAWPSTATLGDPRVGVHAWSALLAGQPAEPPALNLDPRAPAAVLYAPAVGRGVLFSHRALLANALQLRAWLPAIRPGRETVVSAVPLAHVYGLTAGLNLAVYLAASLVLAPNASPAALLATLRRRRPLLFVAAPTHYQALDEYAHAGRSLYDAVRLCLSAAGALPVEVREAFERMARARVLEGYSLAEAGLITLAQPATETRTGTVGLPLPSTEARVVDLETGQAASTGAIGELWVRGPQLMEGYLPGGGAHGPGLPVTLDEQGWAHTGDLARMDDDGYFQVLGRRRDLWRAPDGSVVIARDVEEVIYELPEVSEVAVVAQNGQPAAFVALHTGETLAAEAIAAFCRRRLPASHVPAAITFVPHLPRNYMGQIERAKLRG